VITASLREGAPFYGGCPLEREAEDHVGRDFETRDTASRQRIGQLPMEFSVWDRWGQGYHQLQIAELEDIP